MGETKFTIDGACNRTGMQTQKLDSVNDRFLIPDAHFKSKTGSSYQNVTAGLLGNKIME